MYDVFCNCLDATVAIVQVYERWLILVDNQVPANTFTFL